MIFVYLLNIALTLAQLAAYFQGMELWLGIGWLLSLLILAIAMMVLPFAPLAVSAVAFYGAWKGWHWEWWQAALLPFASVILVLVAAGTSTAVELMSPMWRRRQAG